VQSRPTSARISGSAATTVADAGLSRCVCRVRATPPAITPARCASTSATGSSGGRTVMNTTSARQARVRGRVVGGAPQGVFVGALAGRRVGQRLGGCGGVGRTEALLLARARERGDLARDLVLDAQVLVVVT
jgi:hypothetical protein